jgi:putative membrane protein
VLAHDGIIGWNITRTFFQRRAGLRHPHRDDRGRPPALRRPGRRDRRGAGGVADAAVPGLLAPFLDAR